MAALSSYTEERSVLLAIKQRAALKKSLRIWIYIVGTFVLEFPYFGPVAADISKQQPGHNSSDDITQMPKSSSTTQDPDDMTLEEYRQASGGSLPPEYSLAAAAVGAFILILTMFVVAVLTVLRNKFCSKPQTTRMHPDNIDMVSIDHSKASTNSNSRPATIKFKKNTNKSQTKEYQPVELKDKTELSSEIKKCKANKGDLEQKCSSRKSSTTTADSITPREHYVSTSSIPAFDV